MLKAFLMRWNRIEQNNIEKNRNREKIMSAYYPRQRCYFKKLCFRYTDAWK